MKNEQEILKYYTEELERHKNRKYSCIFSPNLPLVLIDDWNYAMTTA